MSEILRQVIDLRKLGKKEEALALCKVYVKNNPEDSSGNYQCAWCHDVLGLEKEAVPYYVKAIKNGLKGEDLEGAYLGLGSTYRCLGEYQKSAEIFEEGIRVFPGNKELEVFYAMTLYNLKKYDDSIKKLLKTIAETSEDENIKGYKDAILFYSDKLDKVFY